MRHAAEKIRLEDLDESTMATARAQRFSHFNIMETRKCAFCPACIVGNVTVDILRKSVLSLLCDSVIAGEGTEASVHT